MKQLIGIFVLALAASSIGAQPEMEPEMELVAAELWQLGMADTEGTHFCRAEFRKGSHRYEGSAWCDAGGKTAVNWQGFRVPIEREFAAVPLLPEKALTECADILKAPELRDTTDPLLAGVGEELASLIARRKP